MPKVSRWQPVKIKTVEHIATVRSWFSPLCDDMTPEKADVLHDRKTGREKKIRALMLDRHGRRRWAVRTIGKTFTITLKPVEGT